MPFPNDGLFRDAFAGTVPNETDIAHRAAELARWNRKRMEDVPRPADWLPMAQREAAAGDTQGWTWGWRLTADQAEYDSLLPTIQGLDRRMLVPGTGDLEEQKAHMRGLTSALIRVRNALSHSTSQEKMAGTASSPASLA